MSSPLGSRGLSQAQQREAGLVSDSGTASADHLSSVLQRCHFDYKRSWRYQPIPQREIKDTNVTSYTSAADFHLDVLPVLCLPF